jgi:hypothetical protein
MMMTTIGTRVIILLVIAFVLIILSWMPRNTFLCPKCYAFSDNVMLHNTRVFRMKDKNVGFWYLHTFLSSLCGRNMIIIDIGENNAPCFIISITCL